MSRVTLLGFTLCAEAAAVHAAMAGVKGPAVFWQAAGEVVCLAEPGASPRGGPALARTLARRQLRLERAGLAGRFLAADPATACCTLDEVRALLPAEAAPLAEAVRRHGALRQWDLVVTWPAEALLAPQRDALAAAAAAGRDTLAAAVRGALAAAKEQRLSVLAAALRGVAMEMAPLAGEATAGGFTVLLDPARLPALEAALGALPATLFGAARADLRGPMPALSFAAVRLRPAQDMAAAWTTLALPASVSGPELQAHWRRAARAHHPDHGGGDGGAMAAATGAFRAVQAALRGLPEGTRATLADLAPRGRLVLPPSLGRQP